MSKPTAKVSPKSLKNDVQDSVRKARRSQVYRPLRKPYRHQREGCELVDASLSSC